jgi:hypothetical protein
VHIAYLVHQLLPCIQSFTPLQFVLGIRFFVLWMVFGFFCDVFTCRDFLLFTVCYSFILAFPTRIVCFFLLIFAEFLLNSGVDALGPPDCVDSVWNQFISNFPFRFSLRRYDSIAKARLKMTNYVVGRAQRIVILPELKLLILYVDTLSRGNFLDVFFDESITNLLFIFSKCSVYVRYALS